MPRVNRKRKKKTSGYTKWHVEQLEHGHDWGEGFGGDVDAMREAWEIFYEKYCLEQNKAVDWLSHESRLIEKAWYDGYNHCKKRAYS